MGHLQNETPHEVKVLLRAVPEDCVTTARETLELHDVRVHRSYNVLVRLDGRNRRN